MQTFDKQVLTSSANISLNTQKNIESNTLQKQQRKILINTYKDPNFEQSAKFCTNEIKTSKYTFISFLPLGLFYQFNSCFNLFFLITAILQSISILSPLAPLSAIIPFIVVLIISLIREAIEDIRKYQYDKESNNSITIIYKSSSFKETKWMDMQVGSIIKVSKNEILPADILIIKSSNKAGICYMETTNLDGENALKPRESINYTQTNIIKDEDIDSQFNDIKNTYIEVDKPNMDIYNAEGTFFINKSKVYFDIKNILLRGARLKNVDYIYGIVIYTGKDTKLMMNINKTSLKYSHIDKSLDLIVIYIFIICMMVCIICTLLGTFFRIRYFPDYEEETFDLKGEYMFYYDYKNNKRKDFLEIMRIFVANFVIFNTFIPISIIIMTAIVKVFSALVMELFEPEFRLNKDDKIKCFTTTLQEDFGMIKYIFTDKTGTLTRNEMLFKACSIFTELYDNEENNYKTEDNMKTCNNEKDSKSNNNNNSNKSNKSAFCDDFIKDIIISPLKEENRILKINNLSVCPFKSQTDAVREFFYNIALNHNVLREVSNEKEEEKEGERDKEFFIYQGANPDEVTLVKAANEIGFSFIKKENNKLFLSVKNHSNNNEITQQFEQLQKFDFTSLRQRSSIILKDLTSNKIKLYLKGSDKKVFQSLGDFSTQNILEKTKEDLDNFARRGLRTLCYSYKELNINEYNEWEKKYNELKYQCINNKELYDQLEEVISEIESNAILLGVSALEDKLQDEVKEDIQNFIEAGINVWMITGDKMDTAESIGQACKLFSDDTEVFKIKDTKNIKDILRRMREILNTVEKIENENVELVDFNRRITENVNEDKSISLNDESIFRFMKEKNLFETSNEEFEKLTLLKGKVREFSILKENSNAVDKNNIFNNNNNQKDILSLNFGSIIINPSYINNIKYIKNYESAIPSSNEKLLNYFNFSQQKLLECNAKKEEKISLFGYHSYFYQKAKKENDIINSEKTKKGVIPIKPNFALIIEGQSITTCMSEGDAEELFWKLIQKSKSLICCRASPIQKSQVVNFIKKHTSDITLAIGDGGNDVSMIKSAHVGIGIFGKEGYQAAYNSDYAISQFKYLKRLIFFKGRLTVERISYFIYHYFFKNLIFTFPQFLLCIYSGYSGTNLYDDWFYMGFNSFVTIAPITTRAIAEEEFDPDFIEYTQGKKNELKYLLPDVYKEYRDIIPFNIAKFFIIFLFGIVFSLSCFYVPAYVFQYGLRGISGQNFSYWDISLGCFLSVVIFHIFVMWIDSFFYNWFTFGAFVLQFLVDVLFFVIYEACDYGNQMSGDIYEILGCWNFWLTFIIAIAICAVPFYAYRRAEFFFGGTIVNMIKQKKFEHLYIEKFYRKKVEHIIKSSRAVKKFKRIYKEEKQNMNSIDREYDNLTDQQMKKIVHEFILRNNKS